MHWTFCDTAHFSEETLLQAYNALSPSRKAHIDRLKQQADKIRSLTGELLVQSLLQEYYPLVSGVLHRHPGGQPYLAGCNLFVSISHCDQMVACAVSQKPVGIDIEKIRPVNLKLCRHICVEDELEYLLKGNRDLIHHNCDNPEILHRFFEIWTGKEAYFKKCGTGITDLKSVNILSLPRDIHIVDDYMVQIL